MHDLKALLRIKLPIIQAPMAGVQGSRLAIAVSNAGGLGSLPCAMLSTASLRNELTAIKAATDKPFNVNFFCHTPPLANAERESAWRKILAPYYREFGLSSDDISASSPRLPFSNEAADLLEEFRPEVVSFHFGLPSAELLARVRGWGAKILSSATTIEEAAWLERHGVDAIIAQGLEAGGHRGMFLTQDLDSQIGIFALLPQIVRAVNIPVIATGGIVDANDVAAALRLGAAGVQVGTAYLLCAEADTSAVHRAALKSDSARHTALTNIFTGRPARGIANRLMRELGPIDEKTPEFPLAATALAPLRAKAESLGGGDFSPLWAGQNASRCREISAAELTRELAQGL
ncbi:nitronate monooxygenase [Pseudolysobacter antarcticus]|uniref:Nitronate monooxygenase n=1 Tax=Pseudolysobacter antarcticus TaxID=2511995 RepID=A0A411HKJ1_9GAMM|nr:nitronate monooxygenase [Pseudolysobacter antarcticus]QBB71035.1 nitronate monooxygenase [Pseudolysobacter antarcticus]